MNPYSDPSRSLQETNALLQAVFDASTSTISVYKPIYNKAGDIEDYEIIMVNNAVISMLKGKDPVGMRYTELLPGVIEAGVIPIFNAVMLTGEIADYEKEYRKDNIDSIFHVVARKSGEFLVVVADDISQRKRAEKAEQTIKEQAQKVTDKYHQTKAQLESALKAGLGGTFYWDIRTNLVITDENLQQYFSLSSEALDQGVPLSEVLPAIHEEDRPMVEKALAEAIEKTGVYLIQYRLNHSDKSLRWLSAWGQVERDSTGAVIGLPGFVLDITPLREAEIALRQSEERYRHKLEQEVNKRTEELSKQRLKLFENEELLKKKDEFIGIASHELKTPLASIKIYAETLQERFEQLRDEPGAAVMNKLNLQVDRLTDLIKNLLDTSKIAEGRMTLYTEHFCVDALIRERMEELQRITQRHTIIFNAGDIKGITADRERIGQVLTNLISNAIKYSQDGEIVIISEMLPDGIKVSVRDYGIGIPPEFADKVFERFFRVSNSVMSTYPGMGLGLYISAGIIQQHGGTIFVESKTGEGSVFSFTLPFNNQ